MPNVLWPDSYERHIPFEVSGRYQHQKNNVRHTKIIHNMPHKQGSKTSNILKIQDHFNKRYVNL